MTSTLSARFVLTLVLVSLWLSGCAHSPRSKDMVLKPDLIEMKNKEQMDKLSYLGRFILRVHPGCPWVAEAGYRSSPPQWK